MRVLSCFVGLMCLAASSVSADTVPSMELRSIFLHGREYPGASHTLHLQLASESGSVDADTQLSSFGEHVFAKPLLVAGPNHFSLSIKENGGPLLNIRIKIDGRNIETIPQCRRLHDLDKIFPYKGFSSYVPRGTIVIGCETRLGLIELQLRCRNETAAAACGSLGASQGVVGPIPAGAPH